MTPASTLILYEPAPSPAKVQASVLAYPAALGPADEAARDLAGKGFLVRAAEIGPHLDEDMLARLAADSQRIVTAGEGPIGGAVREALGRLGLRTPVLSLGPGSLTRDHISEACLRNFPASK